MVGSTGDGWGVEGVTLVPGGAVAGGNCIPGGCVAGFTGVGLGVWANAALKHAKTKSARTSALINAQGIWFDIAMVLLKKRTMNLGARRCHLRADR